MGRSALISLSLGLGFLSSVGCNGSDFAGSSGRRAEDARPATESPEGPDLGTKSKTDKKDRDEDDNDPTGGDDSQDETPGSGEDTGSNGPSIVDLIEGLLGSGGSTVKPNQPDENTIDFGTDKFFHIGDDRMDDTTCKLELRLAALAGTQFYFEFEVKKDGTDVALDILRVCGVDYGDSNDVRILRSGTNAVEIAKQVVNVGDSSIRVTGTGLSAGSYVVVVESQPNQASQGDRDDYLVGNVKLKATKAIKAGKVGAR